jgi:DNA (cytosine-5)-methyltransferase 1
MGKRRKQAPKLRAVDLYCGSGAVSEALKRHGYRVLVAVDNDPVACRTYKLNHRRTRLICEDIARVDPRHHPKFRGIPSVDLLVVCAPCQPFSSQNRNRRADLRASLILESVKFAAALSPTVVLFENVSGLAAPGNSKVLDRLRLELGSVGYLLGAPLQIDAANCGVPQRRVRCVMIAAKNGSELERFRVTGLPMPLATVRDTIEHLPPLKNGERSEGDPLHFARKHQDIVIERLRHILADGGSRAELPAHLELACHRGRPRKCYSDVYGRMSWDDVAPTLTTGCTDVTRGRFAHPVQNRAITLREAALLQTFPAAYRFYGNVAQVARQIGNAVPVRMVEALLPALELLLRPSKV